MNKNKGLAILSYITWIGLIVVFFVRDKEDTLVRRHLNQALIINIVSTISGILAGWGSIFAIIGTVLSVACFVFFIMGIVRAIKMSEEPLPIIGGIELIK